MGSFTTGQDTSLVAPTETIRVLGETGKTVVYLFPDGRAIAERETPDFDALQTQTCTISLEMCVLEDLVADGSMSAAQKAVVLHDHTATGMSITEILVARGWL